MSTLMLNDAWPHVLSPTEKSVVGYRQVVTVKVGPDGSIDRLKERLEAERFTQGCGDNNLETFFPIARCLFSEFTYLLLLTFPIQTIS